MTTFADWREYGENLGRFASVREKAESPSDRIVIQNKNGIQKIVAGDTSKTLVVTVGYTASPNSRAVVSARLLLSTFKTLKGKGEASIEVIDGGAEVRALGGSVRLENLEGYFKFLTPQPYKADRGRVIPLPEGFFESAAKYLSITADYHPFNQVLGVAKHHKLYLRSTEEHIMAKVGPIEVDDDFKLHFPVDLFPAMRGFEAKGGIYVPEHVPPQVHQAQFFSGKYRVATVIYPNYGVFPEVAEHEYTSIVSGDKKVLIDTFKSLAGRHQYSYSVMEASGGKFTVRSGGSGAATPNVKCEGTGTLPVNAAFMAKVLQMVDGKNATIEFADSPSMVRVTGDQNNWPILVSPMTRNQMG